MRVVETPVTVSANSAKVQNILSLPDYPFPEDYSVTGWFKW
jgi:hypothetical protein